MTRNLGPLWWGDPVMYVFPELVNGVECWNGPEDRRQAINLCVSQMNASLSPSPAVFMLFPYFMKGI